MKRWNWHAPNFRNTCAVTKNSTPSKTARHWKRRASGISLQRVTPSNVGTHNCTVIARACYALAPSSPGPFSHAMRVSQLRWGKGSDHQGYVPLPVYVGEGRLAEAKRRKQGEGQSRHQST